MVDLLPNNLVPSSEIPPSEPPQAASISAFPGVLVAGRFWHFADQISDVNSALRRAKNYAERLINALAGALLLGCLAIFVLGTATIGGEKIISYKYWSTPSFNLFAFWLCVLCALFLFYRMQDAKTRQRFVPKTNDDLEVTILPTLDVVERKENIGQVITEETRQALEAATRLAVQGQVAEVTPAHLFVGLLSSRPLAVLFLRLGLTFDQMKDPIRRHFLNEPRGTGVFGFKAHEIMALAFKNAANHHRAQVGPIEVFAECFAKDQFLQELLFSVGIEANEFSNAIAWVRINEKLSDRYKSFRRAAGSKPVGAMNRAYTAVQTPLLDKVSEDLTRSAVYGHLPMLVGREPEMAQVLRAIEGGRQSVVLVGPPGVGKRALIAGLAERMVAEEVPTILQDKRLVRLSVPHIVSSGGNAQELFLVALSEVARSGNIVLVIENIHELVSASVDLTSVLSSELDKGYTFVVATTTPQAYVEVIERSTLAQKLEKIKVDEPSRDDAIQVLESKVGLMESKNSIVYTFEAVQALIDLSSRYLHDAYLPQKAIVLAEEVGLMVGKRGEKWGKVTKEDVAAIISEKTKVPVTQVTQEEGEKLLSLEKRMHERMIGQEEAVKAVSSALRRARAELRSQNRPIANFLFLGSTGVGKTELAKTTAEVYFGSEEAMIRFDMSEYQDKTAVFKLIGGSGEAGLLTEAVRQKPFSLVLLDELEKAHPDILNLFLQVMDDGRLTDGQGRTIDFTNVILIATSNAGTQYIQDEVAKGTAIEAIKEGLLENELRGIYRPEFLNRFDGVIIFKPLSQEDVVAIAFLMINKVAQRLAAKGINLRASDEAVFELAKKGYDPKFGARPLRRVIQENVENAVADYLLRGQVGRRDTLVLEAGGVITVEKAAELS